MPITQNISITIAPPPSVTVSVVETNLRAEVSGAMGPRGVGLPTGGATGQILRKASSANYDTNWENQPRITVSDTPPLDPDEGDLWVDTS